MWMTAAVWTLLMRTSIALEEQELRGRFGDSYLDYCRRVPGFIPRLFPHRQQKLAGR
jgi:protein-S-isoprenylcysteine O-methyltransferase Ste14